MITNQTGEGSPRFVGAEEFQGAQQGVLFKDIVMLQVKRIAELGSKEMMGGYWQRTPRMLGQQPVMEEVYIPSSREEYSNAVALLEHLLLPHFDDVMTREAEKIRKAKQAALKLVSLAHTVIRSKVKLKYHIRLFRQLSLLLKRLDYFSEMGGEA